MSQSAEPRSPLSLARILSIVLPAAIVGIATYVYSTSLESKARDEMATNVFERMLPAGSIVAESAMAYADKDGDLVADPPEDAKDCISPEVLEFSFVAGAEESVPEPQWKEVFAALKAKTGHDVKYIHYENVDEQLAALKSGKLHIAGLNTGIVPTAVCRDGFVPICTFGREDGTYGYTMQFLVPTGSSIKDVAGIRGHKVMFTRLDSNSGFKAPLVYLMGEKKMIPERDYQWGFSQGHEDSIKGVAAKEIEVAPVASDILARMVEKGEIDASSTQSIYTSERFPPAAIGIAYNLSPELRENIRAALVDFSLIGTGLEGEFGADATKLVPIKYKDDWANTRAIDKMVADARTRK